MKLLNKKEAAAYLNISERTVDYFRTRGNLPFHIIGGKLVRFDLRELERWALGKETDKDEGQTKEERNA